MLFVITDDDSELDDWIENGQLEFFDFLGKYDRFDKWCILNGRAETPGLEPEKRH